MLERVRVRVRERKLLMMSGRVKRRFRAGREAIVMPTKAPILCAV